MMRFASVFTLMRLIWMESPTLYFTSKNESLLESRICCRKLHTSFHLMFAGFLTLR